MSVLPEGFLTYDNISANSICSFGVNSSDVKYVISPAQCVLGSLNPNKLGWFLEKQFWSYPFNMVFQHFRVFKYCSKPIN